jgi:predicted transcriptional regulator
MVPSPPPDNTARTDTNTSSAATIKASLADINYLARSHNRLRILELLCASSCSWAALRENLDIHRTTLQKNLNELEKRNWIENIPTDNVYRVLPAGRIVVQSIRETMADFRTADRLDETLALLPEASPRRALRACNVTRCDSHPYAPIQRLRTLVEETETFRGFTPVFNPLYVSPIKQRIRAEHESEIIAPPTFFEMIRDDDASALNRTLQAESVQLLISDALPPFGVALLDDVAIITVYGSDMKVHTLLEANSKQQALIDWIEKQYTAQRETAAEYETLGEEDVTSR